MAASDIKNMLLQFGLTPNKALGQNFLCDDAAARAIALSGDIGGRAVLEIGPGLGSLTSPLLDAASHVVAVEIDERMVDALNERFAGNDKLALIHADFLKVSEEALLQALGGSSSVDAGAGCVGIGNDVGVERVGVDDNAGAGRGVAVAANLPYYVTTPICMRLLCFDKIDITNMSLMLQREAAERFFAKPSSKQYGPLTVLARYYYDVDKLMSLTSDMYYPQPDVDSCVITLKRRDGVKRVNALPKVLENCFMMRRKTIYNNLKAAYGEAAARNALNVASIPESARAETLEGEAFVRLAEGLKL